MISGSCDGFTVKNKIILKILQKFLTSMHGNEAVYAKLRSSACMSIVSPVDAYGKV